MAGQIQSHKQLKVWQLGVELALSTYPLTKQFPKSEEYGLSRQIQRASTSVSANIAEGHARHATKDFLRFLAIALGSLAELDTHLEISRRLQFGKLPLLEELMKRIEELTKMIHGLRRSLISKLDEQM